MNEPDQTRLGWTVVLRRQTVRFVDGGGKGGYADAYELVCCECGDHPDKNYRELSAELRQIRGPYPIVAGIAAYERHVSRYHGPRVNAAKPRRAIAARFTRLITPARGPGAAGETVTAEMGAARWQRVLITWMRSMQRRCGAGI